MIIGIINLKKQIWIVIILIGLIMAIIAANFEKKYDTEININLDESISKENLKIIVNTYGYLLDGYEPSRYVGETNTYFFLYKNSNLQDYKKTKINEYSDYYIYAKYGNKYAKMKYTNSLVMGGDITKNNIFLNKFNNINYLSSSGVNSSPEAVAKNSFKDIDAFKNNKHDMKMLSYLDKP